MVTHLGDIDGLGQGRTSGRQTLASIEQAIQDLRAREAVLQRELEKVTADRAEIVEERLKAYRELAEVRARNAVADGVIDEADRLSARVANLLSARQRTIDDLKARYAAAEERRNGLIAARDGLVDRIDKLEKRLDELALKAREALSSDRGYRGDVEALEAARAVHAKAADKARRAREDRERKGRAYENDPLFMYLWRRRFGQHGYTASGIIKMLDEWVARLVGYHGARANYAVLNEIPVRLDEHVARLAEKLAGKRTVVDDRETAKIRELAHADIAGDLRAARDDEAARAREIEAATAELSDVGEQLNKYAEGLDPAFAKAIEMSTEFLGKEDTNRLIAVARRTPSPTDDEIATRIAGFDRRVAELTSERDRKTQDLEKLFAKRDELLRIAADFRRAHYDDAASEFRGRDVAEVILSELIRGAITGADYWARTRRRQRWRSRPADPYRKSQNFPPFDFDFDDVFDVDDMFDFDDDDFRSGGRF
jgi:chromosome segregation ATPase